MIYDQQRRNMILSQLEPNGVITPAILDAFGAVPREAFVPTEKRSICYMDSALDMGQGRYLPETMITAKMIEAVSPTLTDDALSVGGVAGYTAAILAGLCARVTDLECDDAFGAMAHQGFVAAGALTVSRVIGDLKTGIGAPGTYDVIVLNGAVDGAPEALLGLLRPNGRMVACVMLEGSSVGSVMLYEKNAAGHVSGRVLFDASLTYMPGCAPQQKFVFA